MNIAAYTLGIPKIDSLLDLSNAINLSEYTLQRILNSVDDQYYLIKIPKKDNSFREVYSPSPALKAIQKWILENILQPIAVDPSATAFQKGVTIRNNVELHIDNQFLLCMDIKDFFPSIKKNRVYQLFRSVGYDEHISLVFSRFCTYKEFLPQGAVTSPSISNIISIKLDRRLNGYCSLRNIVYSRYADDFTFSSNNTDKLRKSINILKAIIEDEGYTLNTSKTRLLIPGNKRKVTGLIISDSKSISIGRKQRRILRAKIHHSIFKMEKNTDSWRLFNKHINGWLSFLKGIDYESYISLLKYRENLKQKKKEQEDIISVF
ncbi:retron St85 family RNA-directed DNA polymerase [Terribacillus saccharophilus]|uniref:RNA-directed DNA polymerase n=1 Tax=Terribacillus saccharophilus TaxID=361277 RepID=A0ABX4GY82_9BACI|nr:retron St85 family RNA-directed DNA polymerase [Terribacillus saccharophilus]PAD35834.1 hypothetical protein CHH56_07450 [Terribacillus saccharophilus]PAD96260.1 hypothetical protein CHH50_09105 [Terribacillus saccharophilus]PAD99835.1 hypothetical protein CHH48_10010 [Terribacillus saccharophilus]